MKLDPVGSDSRLAVQEVKERDARDACASAEAPDTPGTPSFRELAKTQRP
jgi:hypothetical protein